jgi:DNA-binding transcriptional LysR family regulator
LKSLSAANLSRFKWIFSNPGNLHRRRLEQYFEFERVPLPQPTAETSSPALIKSIVLQSDCIALMAKMGAQAELDAGLLDGVKIKSPLMVRSVGLIWRSNHPLSAAAHRVVETVRSICEERGHHPAVLC